MEEDACEEEQSLAASLNIALALGKKQVRVLSQVHDCCQSEDLIDDELHIGIVKEQDGHKAEQYAPKKEHDRPPIDVVIGPFDVLSIVKSAK